MLLLGVSYGVYEVITTPDPTLNADASLTTELNSGDADATDALQPFQDSNSRFGNQLADNGTWNGNNSTATPDPNNHFGQSQNSERADDQSLNALKNHLSDGAGAGATGQAGKIPNTIEPENQFVVPATITKPLSLPRLSAEQVADTWRLTDQYINEGKFRAALGALSRIYDQADVTGLERQKLMTWLDSLAAKVIYSTEHNLFNKPHIVMQNESLQSISRDWGVPPQLIYNINRAKISDPNQLMAGNELKMIKGPFRGVVDLSNQTMTLYLNNLYAGRFTILNRPNIASAEVQVQTKSEVMNNGRAKHELMLGRDLSITSNSSDPGCICMSEKHAADVFAILSEGSMVTIRR